LLYEAFRIKIRRLIALRDQVVNLTVGRNGFGQLIKREGTSYSSE